MLDKLSREERLQLMRFICSFAWADLQVREQEREFVRKMILRLDLDADEAKEVRGWLEVPPAADEVDPMRIPRAHRQLFLETAREMISSDGEIGEEERESLSLLEQLTR
ncbi:TerB family tellurite resistance protein [Sorangium sp. So ce1036]|uniref:tellurite resistance TerB family protein n=1 Tax=Sorangium sp. So ce1036 TaxID=3133328 RepID=UPI003EFFE815